MAGIDRINNPGQQVFAWLKVAEVCNVIPGMKTTGLLAMDLSSEKVEKIRDTQLRADRQSTLAEHNLAYGRELEALALLDAALEVSKKQKDAHERITVLDHVAAGYLRAGKAEKASAVVADIDDLYARSAAYDRMVDYYASIGQLDKAAEKAASIERPYTRAYTLSHLAVAQHEAGIPGAVDLLKRAWMAAEKVKDRFLKSSAMGQVAGSRATIGQVDEALALTEQIADEVVQAATLKKIAAGFAKEGRYDRAVAVADGIAHPYYQASTLNRLAEIARVGLGGDPAQAQQWLVRAAKISDKIEDVYQQHAVRVDTVNGLASLGEFDQAVKLAGLLEDRYHFATALYHVTHQYTLQKQYEEAIRMAEAIDDPYYRASALTEIAGALFESGPVAFKSEHNELKRIEIETARSQVYQVSAAMMKTPNDGLIRYAVAEEVPDRFSLNREC